MNAVMEAARGFIGVPWRHRGRNRLGIDCAGLCWAAYHAAGVTLPDYRLYGREPHRDGLVAHTAAALGDPVMVAPVDAGAMMPGDVLVMRFTREPHHMGVVGVRDYGGTPALTLIHADGDVGLVHEQRMTPDMVARITHVFRRPV